MFGNKSNSPDFAFPKKVRDNAEVLLDKALKKGDGQATVEALIQWGVAECMITPDSVPSVVKRVNDITANESNPVTCSLLKILNARILLTYYNGNSFNINRRTTVAGEQDIKLWSGEQFRDTIAALVTEAVADRAALQKARTADFKKIIETNDVGLVYYPTLLDFASQQAINVLSTLSKPMHILPLRFFIVCAKVPALMPEINRRVIEIADAWVAANKGTQAPLVKAMLERNNYLQSQCTIDSNNSEKIATALQLFESCYGSKRANPFAVEFLLQTNPRNQVDIEKMYNVLTDFTKKNPKYQYINAVYNYIAQLTCPHLEIETPTQVAKGVPFNIIVEARNLKDFKLFIFRISDTSSSAQMGDTQGAPIATIPVNLVGKIPGNESVTVQATLPDYGRYIVTNSAIKSPKQYNYDVINCSDLVLVDNSYLTNYSVWALDMTTGKPVSDADVKIATYTKTIGTVKTDAEGAAAIPELKPDNSYYFNVSKGNDRHARSLYEWIRSYKPKARNAAFVRTDLAVYHPGDSASFVTFAYSFLEENRTPLADKCLIAKIFNTNLQLVDSLRLTTDDFGRASGDFQIPREGLTGEYNVSIFLCENEEDNGEYIGEQSFMVSDYKLPTYEVTVESVTAPKEVGGSVEIKCKALTYSGFPVQDAQVNADISARSGWWWGGSIKFGELQATTDSEGIFTLKLDSELLSQSPYPKGVICVDMTVTSATGENRAASTKFSVSTPYAINFAAGKYIKAMANTRLNASVVDMLCDEVDSDLAFEFSRDGQTVTFNAKSVNGIATVDLTSLKSGRYSLKISAPATSAEAVEQDVVVYNPADKTCPVEDEILWMPEQRMTVAADARIAKYLIATPIADGQPMLLLVNNADGTSYCKWLTLEQGFNEIDLEVPEGSKGVTATMIAVKDGENSLKTLNISVSHPEQQLKVEIEAMRDKLLPNSQETVTIKVSDGNKSPLPSALVLDMYCKALDAIASQSWSFNPITDYIPSPYSSISLNGTQSDYFQADPVLRRVANLVVPTLNFYGREYVFGESADDGMMMYYSMGSSPKLGRSRMMMSVECAENSVMADEAAPMPAESYVAVDVAETEEDSGTASDSAEEYRPSEIALGFFAPRLTIGADGSLSYTFTVPNANTTWVLNALAVSKIFSTDLATTEIISSKPVMVEPNMPRFIRRGDFAQVRAAVMNATDAETEVTTVFEILDPATMKVVSSQSAMSKVAAHGSVTEVFDIDANTPLSTMLVRVKSTSANYTDGVQTLLPVLEASQPVIDAKTFYLAPNQSKFSMPIPKAGEDAVTTVTFCDNPTWEVVSALPGLRADNDGTSLQASAAIFSAAVARRVLELNPQIAPHLKEWLDGNKDDKAMLSMLNRNEELKQMVLSATPWVSNACSDVERITRLALLFDPNEISSAISTAEATLSKLQQPGGGWRWSASSREASTWVTLMILNNFAELRQLKCLPDELDSQIADGCKFIDAYVGEMWQKYPGYTAEYYTYVRSLFPEVKLSGNAQKVYNASIKEMKEGWRNYGLCNKAAVALVLYRNGDAATARLILSSIREFASSSPEQGMWFDSIGHSTYNGLYANGQTAFILDAFNTIEPGCAEIDPLRQWLILNKVVQDWGTSVNTSAIVASILNSGSNWLYKPGEVTVKVGGKKVSVDTVDKLTGRFVVEIDTPKGDLSISRKSKSPVWGAVVNRSTQVMTEIEAASLPELSITKQILVKKDGEWVDADDLGLGQVAKIRLIITSQRDMDYVTIVDQRAACLEPVIQTPRDIFSEGLYFYLENRDDRTNLFIDRLLKGTFILEYEMYVNNAGEYASGIATIQSQYTPEMTAHSSGRHISVK